MGWYDDFGYGASRSRDPWNVDLVKLQKQQKEDEKNREPPVKDAYARRAIDLSNALQTSGRFQAEDGSFQANLVAEGAGDHLFARVTFPSTRSPLRQPAHTKPVLLIAVPRASDRAKAVGAAARTSDNPIARILPGAEQILEAHTTPGNFFAWTYRQTHRLTPSGLPLRVSPEESLVSLFCSLANQQGVNKINLRGLARSESIGGFLSRDGFRKAADGTAHREPNLAAEPVPAPAAEKKERASPIARPHSPEFLIQLVTQVAAGKTVNVQGSGGKPLYSLSKVSSPDQSHLVALAKHANGDFSFVTLAAGDNLRKNARDLLQKAAQEGLSGAHPAPLASIQVRSTKFQGEWVADGLFDLGQRENERHIQFAAEGMFRKAAESGIRRILVPENMPLGKVESTAKSHGYEMANKVGYRVFTPRMAPGRRG